MGKSDRRDHTCVVHIRARIPEISIIVSCLQIVQLLSDGSQIWSGELHRTRIQYTANVIGTSPLTYSPSTTRVRDDATQVHSAATYEVVN